MKSILKTFCIVLCLNQIQFGVGQRFVPTLKIGDLAPPLNVIKWAKGTPIPRLKLGQVYAVEFWGTGCGPCKRGMPHLSEIARRYRKAVTVISVDVYENQSGKNPSYVDMVQKFVDQNGKNMDYNVAIDGPESTTAKTWLQASGKNGVPQVFIITKTGRIGWIGHPVSVCFELALDAAVAGTLDEVGIELMKKEAEVWTQLSQLSSEFNGALRANDYVAAKARLDAMDVLNPPSAIYRWTERYLYLAATEPKAARELGEAYIKDNGGENSQLLSIAYTIIAENGLENPDYELAIKILREIASSPDPSFPYLYSQLAYAYSKSGDFVSAIEWQQKYIAAIEAARNSDKDRFTDDSIAEGKKILERYKKQTKN